MVGNRPLRQLLPFAQTQLVFQPLLFACTFYEFIHLKNLHTLIKADTINWNGNIALFSSATNIAELNRHFINYLNFWGYPEVIFNPEIENDPGRFMRADIIDKVLLRDLPGLYGIKDVQEFLNISHQPEPQKRPVCSSYGRSRRNGRHC